MRRWPPHLLAAVVGLAACAQPVAKNAVAPSLGGTWTGSIEDTHGTGSTDAHSPDDATTDGGGVDAGLADAAPADAGAQNGSGPNDSGAVDTSLADANSVDAGMADLVATDAGAKDGGWLDSGVADAGPLDLGSTDSGSTDSGSTDSFSGALSSCCQVSNKPKCGDPAIEACVCAKDDFCCKKAWDQICVQEVSQWGCAKCSAGGSGGGNDASGANDGSSGTSDTGVECSAWNAARADLSEGLWSGAVSGCVGGDMADVGRNNTLKLVNLYRQMAGLPAVQMTAQWDPALQACALMMTANASLSHNPPTTWQCYSAQGALMAGQSNIATTPAVQAVDLYMIDPGNAQTLGHRRWILSNSLGPIGVGSTGGHSCLKVIGGQGKAGKLWTAWPPPGKVPYQAFHTFGWTSLDATGWSIQSDTLNLAAGKVLVSQNGQPLPVVVQKLLANYGSAHAISIVPQNWTAQVGATYHVEVTGLPSPISYDVQVTGCK